MTTRPVEEIQRAHDLLVGIITGDVPSPVQTPAAIEAMTSAAAALCWVLRHDHNPLFENYLRLVEEHLKEMGWELHDHGN